MHIRSISSALVFVIAAMCFTKPALAATCDDVMFANSVERHGGKLVLNGLGIRKVTSREIKVYVAGLYLPAPSGDADAILGAGGPWRLDFQFVHDVEADDMAEAYRRAFDKANDVTASLGAKIDTFVNMFIDFKVGQVLTFDHDPAAGVAVEFDGGVKGMVEGADFGTALLTIWLGPEPPNEDLKTGLLGGSCE